MWFEYQTVKFQWVKSFTFANGHLPRGPTPPTVIVSRIDGKQFNSFAKCLQAQCKISPYHKTFTFYDSSLKFLVRQFSFWYCIIIVANKLRGNWDGSGIDPTGFGLYPTSIPPGVIVQKCQIVIE